jgi:hypothetical protein
MWGRGRLSFRAGQHSFSISGAPVSAVSAPSLTATGKVFHLAQLSDFAGKYVRIDAADTSSVNHERVAMRNEHGVVIMLRVATAAVDDGPTRGSVQIQLTD